MRFSILFLLVVAIAGAAATASFAMRERARGAFEDAQADATRVTNVLARRSADQAAPVRALVGSPDPSAATDLVREALASVGLPPRSLRELRPLAATPAEVAGYERRALVASFRQMPLGQALELLDRLRAAAAPWTIERIELQTRRDRELDVELRFEMAAYASATGATDAASNPR